MESQPNIMKWEYRFHILDFGNKSDERPFGNAEVELNKLGDEGWEVASVLTKWDARHFWAKALLKRIK